MRQVTKEVVMAFINGESRKLKNTETDGKELKLFGHVIAFRADDGKTYATLAGWGTPTTRERLNGLYQFTHGKRPFHQINHVQHFDGQPIGDTEIFCVDEYEGT